MSVQYGAAPGQFQYDQFATGPDMYGRASAGGGGFGASFNAGMIGQGFGGMSANSFGRQY